MEIKDYLKYYIGCECQLIESSTQGCPLTLTAYNFNYYRKKLHLIKPILRRLSSITEEEKNELFNEDNYYVSTDREDIFKTVDNIIRGNEFRPPVFHYLLSRGFWLFGDEAFETGLIVDQSSLNNTK